MQRQITKEQLDLINKVLEQGYVYSYYIYWDEDGNMAKDLWKFKLDNMAITINKDGFIVVRTISEDLPLDSFGETWWLEEK